VPTNEGFLFLFMVPVELLLLSAALLLLLSVLASKLSTRLGVPALLLFLAIGMLAGSDGPGGIYFDDPYIAQLVGTLALAFILFAGGLDTDWHKIRPILAPGLSLALIGVLATAIAVGAFAMYLLHFSLLEGLLLGAIVSSTDAAAVFAVMRSRGVNLRGQLKPLIEFESGSNDPMAVFLTLGFLQLLTHPGTAPVDLLLLFARQMLLGSVVGLLAGFGMVWLIVHIHLEAEGLYSPLLIALVMLTFAVTLWLGGSGFLAVYLAGLVMGNRDFVHRRSLMQFQDGLAWLMQISMFLVLGLLVFPRDLIPIAGMGLAIAGFLALVARPVSVFLALAPFQFALRERLLVAWCGLRGAVPIILATFPLLAGLGSAHMIFNLVFFVVLTSALVQGTLLTRVARWLRVDAPEEIAPRYPLEFVPEVSLNHQLREVHLPPKSVNHGKSIMELGLPKGVLVVLLQRNGENITPGGSTVLAQGDSLLLLGDTDSIARARGILER
jgi:cell volume regulation protein A